MSASAPRRASCVCLFDPHTKHALVSSRRDSDDEFGFPGGKEDEDETALQAAMREFFEEVGLALTEPPVHVLTTIDDTGFLTSSFLVVSPRDIKAAVEMYRGKTREIERGIKITFKPRETLIAGPFAKYNQRVYDELATRFAVI